MDLAEGFPAFDGTAPKRKPIPFAPLSRGTDRDGDPDRAAAMLRRGGYGGGERPEKLAGTSPTPQLGEEWAGVVPSGYATRCPPRPRTKCRTMAVPRGVQSRGGWAATGAGPPVPRRSVGMSEGGFGAVYTVLLCKRAGQGRTVSRRA